MTEEKYAFFPLGNDNYGNPMGDLVKYSEIHSACLVDDQMDLYYVNLTNDCGCSLYSFGDKLNNLIGSYERSVDDKEDLEEFLKDHQIEADVSNIEYYDILFCDDDDIIIYNATTQEFSSLYCMEYGYTYYQDGDWQFSSNEDNTNPMVELFIDEEGWFVVSNRFGDYYTCYANEIIEMNGEDISDYYVTQCNQSKCMIVTEDYIDNFDYYDSQRIR